MICFDISALLDIVPFVLSILIGILIGYGLFSPNANGDMT